MKNELVIWGRPIGPAHPPLVVAELGINHEGLLQTAFEMVDAAADRLQRMDVPAFKIGSGECNNYPLLEHIARFRKPVILSTGMNTIDSICKAVVNIDEDVQLLYDMIEK